MLKLYVPNMFDNAKPNCYAQLHKKCFKIIHGHFIPNQTNYVGIFESCYKYRKNCQKTHGRN